MRTPAPARPLPDMPQPLLAAAIARTAHMGQRDKQGRDYWEHHLRPVVARLKAAGADEATQAAGWLHDTVEDTDYTAETLRTAGVDEEVIDIVVTVTRQPGEVYMEYIRRVARHPKARMVKLADNEENTSTLDALAAMGPVQKIKARSLRSRYVTARTLLLLAETRSA